MAAFAAAWDGPLDILINNAGIMASPLMRTPEGWESGGEGPVQRGGEGEVAQWLVANCRPGARTESGAGPRPGLI